MSGRRHERCIFITPTRKGTCWRRRTRRATSLPNTTTRPMAPQCRHWATRRTGQVTQVMWTTQRRGMVYMQARYYQPTGRFLSPDPVGPTPGNIFSFNRYAYTNNNPINHVDPDGRCIWDGCVFEAIVIGAVIGGGIDAAAQHYFHPNQPINKTEVAISAVGGAVTGGSASVLTGAASAGTITVGQAVLRQAAVSGATAAAQSAAGDVANGKTPSGQAAVNAAGAGIAGSLVSSGFSSAAGDFAGASANNAMKDMSNAAINTPAGVGSTIANTTKAIGSTTVAPSALQSAASQAGRVGDIISTVGEKKLNQNPNQNQ